MIETRSSTALTAGWAVKHGIAGGIVAGIVFAFAEMVGSRFLNGNPFLMPVASIASVPIGQPPPQIMQTFSTPAFLTIGFATHMVIAAAYGLVFALLVWRLPRLFRSGWVVLWASVWGLALWLLNFYVLAPAIGRPWFTQTDATQQFVYHTFFFGTVLGVYLAAVRPARA